MNFFKSLLSKKVPEESVSTLISSADFKKLIRTYFAPRLRKNGWKGTGFHYHKSVGNNCSYILSFHTDNNGGECWVEIGLHLDFFKDAEGDFYDLKKITCSSLDIRRRISPNKSDNYTWKYQTSEEGNALLLASIWGVFITDGQAFINQFREFPIPFIEIEITDIDKRDDKYQIKGIPFPPDVRTAWYLSQVYLYIGDNKKAKEFADFGLSRIYGQQGSALKSDLKKIKSAANN